MQENITGMVLMYRAWKAKSPKKRKPGYKMRNSIKG